MIQPRKWSAYDADLRAAMQQHSGMTIAKASRQVMAQHQIPEIYDKTFRVYAGKLFAGQYEVKDDEHSALQAEAEAVGFPAGAVTNYWHKGKHFSTHVKVGAMSPQQMRDILIKDMERYAPDYSRATRPAPRQNTTMQVIVPADPHFGKLGVKAEVGEDYNLSIATRDFVSGVEGCLALGQGYRPEAILFVGGNDTLHTDNLRRMTTSGTPQDTDGMWFEHIRAARDSYIHAIESARTIAPVTVSWVLSNHDAAMGYMLGDILKAWFHNCPDVTFDNGPQHRKYITYGRNLIGASHGDGSKEKDLPNLMSTEAAYAWGQATHRYWYLGHVHHKDQKTWVAGQKIQREKDYIGVTVIGPQPDNNTADFCHIEHVRSISGADSWHSKHGYQHAKKAMETFIHDPYYGQVGRLIHTY